MLPATVVDVVGAYFDAADDSGSMESAACATSRCCTSCGLLLEAGLRPPSSATGACSWPGMAAIRCAGIVAFAAPASSLIPPPNS